MDWKDPDGLLPEVSPCHVAPEHIIISVIMDTGKVMRQKNSTGSCHRQEHPVEESGTTIDASIIEAGQIYWYHSGGKSVEGSHQQMVVLRLS